MSQPFLPFSLPDIGEEEIQEVVATLRSGWITTGPKAKQFESDFAAFIGQGVDALAVNSATSGLHLALEAAGVRAEDEVIVPSYTFTATAEVVRYLGAHPVFVDIDAETYNIQPSAIEKAITGKTRAIIPVHFAGLACDMEAIFELGRRYHLKIIEDAAHALPTSFRGQLIGTLDSDATVFSFYANKTMTTAEGGMIVSKNPELLERCKIMRLHGISHDSFDRYIAQNPAWYYEVVEPGFKYNLPDVCAAIGIWQLKKLRRFHLARINMAQRYDCELADLPIILPPRALIGDAHAWHLYPIRLKPDAKLSRAAFIEGMAQHGIGCSVHFIPLHLHPVWRDSYQLKAENFPHAQTAFESTVSLPLYTRMTEEDQSRVIQTMCSLLGA